MECKKVSELRELMELLIKFFGDIDMYLETERMIGFIQPEYRKIMIEKMGVVKEAIDLNFKPELIDSKCEHLGGAK